MFLVNLPGTPADSVTLEASPRPLLLLLLGHLRELPKGALLVVWRLDRLSRLSYEQELLMDMLRKAEVRVHSVQSGEDHILDGGYVHDPARVLMRQVMASYAQYERAIIELRLQSGKNYKAARGGYTGGQPPFGYAAQGKELVIDPFEAEMVRFIFKLHREFHFTPGQISEHVEKHKASHDKTKYYKLKIYRILKTERQYLGYYTDCYGHEHFRPDLTILTKDAKS
jgi:DNA invertase Pin-like site-specific DNA recombinase